MSGVTEPFLSRSTIARLASAPVARVDKAMVTGGWHVLGSGERVVGYDAARATLANLLPARAGDAAARLVRAGELLSPYVAAPGLTPAAAARHLHLTPEIVEAQLASNLLPSVYRRSSQGFQQLVAPRAAGITDASSGAAQLTSPPTRAPRARVAAPTARAISALRSAPAASRGTGTPPTRHVARNIVVLGSAASAVALGPRLLHPGKKTAEDTAATEAHLATLDATSDEGRRAQIALIALQEADRGAMSVSENGAMDPRVLEYIAATDGAVATSDRSWSGDFAAWVTKDVAPIGYGGKGAKNLIDLSTWAGNAGAKVSKDKRDPRVGDIVMLDTFRNETEIDAYAVVTGVDGTTMTVVQGDDGGELQRETYDTGDRAVLGYIDPVAAKAVSAPPPDDESEHIDAGSPAANKPVPPPPPPVPPRDPNRAGAAWESAALTSKGVPVTAEQRENMRLVLERGHEMGVSDRVLTASIATIIVETNSINLPNGDRDSVGLFQQRDPWGSWEERHTPKLAAEKFLVRARNIEARYPDIPVGVLSQSVQVSAFPDAYAVREAEAALAVQAFAAP